MATGQSEVATRQRWALIRGDHWAEVATGQTEVGSGQAEVATGQAEVATKGRQRWPLGRGGQ